MCSSVRRGEGGGERLGGPLWSPAVPFHLVPLPMWSKKPTRESAVPVRASRLLVPHNGSRPGHRGFVAIIKHNLGLM